jgi:hypothetical protein
MSVPVHVVVTGGREYQDRKTVEQTLDDLPIAKLYVGDAKGADRLAHHWAIKRKVPYQMFVANWKLYGGTAGRIRNEEMVATAAMQPVRTILVAFPGGEGTRDCVQRARHHGLAVMRVTL